MTSPDVTSRDDAAGGYAMPHATNPPTEVFHAASTSQPAPQTFPSLRLLRLLGYFRATRPVWGGLDAAAVSTRGYRRRYVAAVHAGIVFRARSFRRLLTSLFVGSDETQKFVEHLPTFRVIRIV